jgi:hypothetical protein
MCFVCHIGTFRTTTPSILLLVPLESRGASRYFLMFRPMVKYLLNIERKTDFFSQMEEIQEAFGTIRKLLVNWTSWR